MKQSDVNREIERMIENRKNERIRELAEQAEEYAFGEFHKLFLGNINPNNANWKTIRQELFNEKFAELVVRECAEHALTFNNNIQSLNDKEIRSHSSRVSNYIKDRMGVEE